MELYKLTGGELHRLMKEKKVSAVEVTEDTFARIAKGRMELALSLPPLRRKQ